MPVHARELGVCKADRRTAEADEAAAAALGAIAPVVPVHCMSFLHMCQVYLSSGDCCNEKIASHGVML